VALDGAKNAAILAVEILAITDEKLSEKLLEFKKNMQEEVMEKVKKLSDQ
jgi:5-(carboxyamino)imidazole ribonucleotide mutase